MTRAGGTEKDAAKTVFPCPQCGQPSVMSTDNHWRPFCCERCKLLDLGEWFSGKYAVAASEADDQLPEDSTLQ